MQRRDVLQKAVLAAGAAVLAQPRPTLAACATITPDGETTNQRFFKITSGTNVCAVSLVSVQAGRVFSNTVSRGCLPQYRVGLPKNNAIYWALVVTNGGTEACCFQITGTVVDPA